MVNRSKWLDWVPSLKTVSNVRGFTKRIFNLNNWCEIKNWVRKGNEAQVWSHKLNRNIRIVNRISDSEKPDNEIYELSEILLLKKLKKVSTEDLQRIDNVKRKLGANIIGIEEINQSPVKSPKRAI